jgi:two-component system, NarL family, sensor histidine kinase UhpB
MSQTQHQTPSISQPVPQGILANAIPEAIWDTDLITGKTYTNDALLAIFGYTHEALANNGLWWSSNLHPDDRERVERGIEAALESTATQWTDMYQFKCSDGQYKTIADRSTIIRDENGKPIRLVGTMLDITESAQRERSLTEALERYNVLMQATQDAIWDMNLITGQTYTNDTLQQLFGYDEELKDNDAWWNGNLHPDDRDRVVAGINEALATGQAVWKDEYRFRCKSGHYKIVIDRSTIIRNENGQPVRLIGAMQDVTSDRILQQALTNQAILKHKTTAKRLLQEQEQEKQVLGNELHENISQMLASVKLFIDHALENEAERVNLLKESSGYLHGVITEIRKLHRDLVPLPMETFTLLNMVQQEAENMLQLHDIKTAVRFTNIDEASLDGELKLSIFRIIQKQLDNISKHSKATEAAIRLIYKNFALQLYIDDNGIGADLKKAPKLGGGFKRIQNRAQVYNGTCKMTTEINGGFSLSVVIPINNS